jgi:hypothetical protein
VAALGTEDGGYHYGGYGYVGGVHSTAPIATVIGRATSTRGIRTRSGIRTFWYVTALSQPLSIRLMKAAGARVGAGQLSPQSCLPIEVSRSWPTFSSMVIR